MMKPKRSTPLGWTSLLEQIRWIALILPVSFSSVALAWEDGGSWAWRDKATSVSRTAWESLDSRSIIGGSAVRASDPIAWTTVALLNNGALCTASLIAQDLAVTAAHCVEGDGAAPMQIHFTRSLQGGSGDRREVRGAVVPTRWGTIQDGETADHGDIALISFAGGLPSGYRTASILWDESGLWEGQTITLAGYGITQTHPHTGAGVLKKTTVKIARVEHGQTEILFDQRWGKGACHGDSGGPAFVTTGGKTWLLGVTNRGYQDPEDTCGEFSVYTKISAYRNFLTRAAEMLRSR